MEGLLADAVLLAYTYDGAPALVSLRAILRIFRSVVYLLPFMIWVLSGFPD
jgi:hypothetical protein